MGRPGSTMRAAVAALKIARAGTYRARRTDRRARPTTRLNRPSSATRQILIAGSPCTTRRSAGQPMAVIVRSIIGSHGSEFLKRVLLGGERPRVAARAVPGARRSRTRRRLTGAPGWPRGALGSPQPGSIRLYCIELPRLPLLRTCRQGGRRRYSRPLRSRELNSPSAERTFQMSFD
jgi:hypothetical protein